MAVSDQEIYDAAGEAILRALKSQEYRVGSNSVNRSNRMADLSSITALRQQVGQADMDAKECADHVRS